MMPSESVSAYGAVAGDCSRAPRSQLAIEASPMAPSRTIEIPLAMGLSHRRD
jgi:hypothetical protein